MLDIVFSSGLAYSSSSTNAELSPVFTVSVSVSFVVEAESVCASSYTLSISGFIHTNAQEAHRYRRQETHPLPYPPSSSVFLLLAPSLCQLR